MITILPMLGATISKIEDTDNEIIFYTDTGIYRMHHCQDCCESVYIEEIHGDLNDLIGHPLLECEEICDPGIAALAGFECSDSCTWTFYKMGTIKSHVTIRWIGESNGYYSESVDFEKMTNYP